jgi:ParB family transcriptional regulator, chromosome partitioning protein
MTTAAVEKKEEKPEKRRALGRGLESLLPGPRVVIPSGEHQPPTSESTGSDGRTVASRADFAHLAASPVVLGSAQAEVISLQARADESASRDVVANLAIDKIDKNPHQTRQVFDEQTLIELRDSIKEHGVVQPVVVRPAEEQGRYILVLGERRLRASKMAGKGTVPALVRRLSPQQAAEMTVLENVVREDLTCLEQAQAFKVLSQEFHLTQAQIAERIGVSRETVANYMRLLRLPQKVMTYMLEEKLTFSDARLLLALESDQQIEQLADEIVSKQLRWYEIEERVMHLTTSVPASAETAQQTKARGARWVDPNVRAAQVDMERILGMRVLIKDRQGKGKIIIEYASVDDYERVVEMLRGSKSA